MCYIILTDAAGPPGNLVLNLANERKLHNIHLAVAALQAGLIPGLVGTRRLLHEPRT